MRPRNLSYSIKRWNELLVVPSQLVLTVKLNHIYIWAGAQAESLIEAQLNEDPELRINKTTALLNQLATCLTHSTYFREQREEFYSNIRKVEKIVQPIFPESWRYIVKPNSPTTLTFFIVDKLIHGCKSRTCQRKIMAKGKDVTIKGCLETMRKVEAVEVTMKKLEDLGDAHVDASYAGDPTKKSQRNGFKKKQVKPKVHQNSQTPDEKKSCVWCQGDVHPSEKCPAKDATCNFCSKQGHFERACLKKKGEGKASKHQHAVDLYGSQPKQVPDPQCSLHYFVGGMLFMVSKMASTSPPLTQKVATGLKNVMNRVNFSMHLIHPLRNTALCAYPLSSQGHLKSSVKKWIRFFLVSLAHFPVQMILKC